MWYFKCIRWGARAGKPDGYPLETWTVLGIFAVVFDDGSALVTQNGNKQVHPKFDVSLGDLIVPDYPLGVEKMWLDGRIKASSEQVWHYPTKRDWG